MRVLVASQGTRRVTAGRRPGPATESLALPSVAILLPRSREAPTPQASSQPEWSRPGVVPPPLPPPAATTRSFLLRQDSTSRGLKRAPLQVPGHRGGRARCAVVRRRAAGGPAHLQSSAPGKPRPPVPAGAVGPRLPLQTSLGGGAGSGASSFSVCGAAPPDPSFRPHLRGGAGASAGRAEGAPGPTPRCGRRDRRPSRHRRRGTCRCAGSRRRPLRPRPRNRCPWSRPWGRRSPPRAARPSTVFRSRCCGGSAGAWTGRPGAAAGGGWRSWRGAGGASG